MKKFSRDWRILIAALSLNALGCLSLENDQKPQIEKALKTQQAIIVNHLNRGEPEKAFAELRPAMQRFPDNQELTTLMGLTQLAMRNTSMAIKYLRTAYKNNADSTTALNLSSAYIESGRNTAALKLLRRHVKSGKLSGYGYPERVYHNLGLAYRNIKKKRLATKFFKKALTENPRFYLSLMQMGEVQLQRKNYTAARKYYRKAIPACNQCFEAVDALATSYLKGGNLAGAVAVLKTYANNKAIPKELRTKAQAELARIAPTDARLKTAKRGSHPTQPKR